MIKNKISTYAKDGVFGRNLAFNGLVDIYFKDSALRLAGVESKDRNSLDSNVRRITKTVSKNLSMLNGVYLSTNREYHDIGHINFGVEFLLKKEIQKLLVEKDTAMVAWFFHDLFLGGKNSVCASACFLELFLKEIGVDGKKISSAYENVMATDHSSFAKSNDGKILADIDLYSLVLPEREFRKNTAKLALECYKEKDTSIFLSEVCQFFLMLLERGHIFQTDFFFQFEERAKKNVERSLKEYLKS